MYQKSHRWTVDEEGIIPDFEELEELERLYDLELPELEGHRVREIEESDG